MAGAGQLPRHEYGDGVDRRRALAPGGSGRGVETEMGGAVMREGLVRAGDVDLGFVRAGSGPRTVVLLHGWPQTSYAWRRVMPLLAPEFTVLAFDLRGVGRSSPAGTGFDKSSMAEDVRTALAGLRIDRPPLLVGHGIGGMAAYAYARRHPADVAGLALLESPLPGVPGWEEAAASPALWHLGFHRDGAGENGHALAEELVRGRQAVYFRRFIDRFAAHPEAITPEDLQQYVRGYRDRRRLAAGFAMFRTLPLDAADNRTFEGELAVPVLAVFGEYGFGTVAETLADGLRASGVRRVRTVLIEDCGHWPAEEAPAALASVLREFAARPQSV